MATKREKKKKKKLRYVLVVEVDPEYASEISDTIESARGYGTCEIEDVSVVEHED